MWSAAGAGAAGRGFLLLIVLVALCWVVSVWLISRSWNHLSDSFHVLYTPPKWMNKSLMVTVATCYCTLVSDRFLILALIQPSLAACVTNDDLMIYSLFSCSHLDKLPPTFMSEAYSLFHDAKSGWIRIRANMISRCWFVFMCWANTAALPWPGDTALKDAFRVVEAELSSPSLPSNRGLKAVYQSELEYLYKHILIHKTRTRQRNEKGFAFCGVEFHTNANRHVLHIHSHFWESQTLMSGHIVGDKGPWRKDRLPVCGLVVVETVDPV